MIVSPTASQLLDAVRNELTTKIKPAVSDGEALAILAMIESILASLAVRCDHEVEWLREEISAIEQGGEAVIDAKADKSGKVAAALQALRAGRGPGDRLPALHAEYQLASEVLSCALEAAMAAGGELREWVTNLLAARVAREALIRGEFSLAGRE